jgi:hypothetical protein
VADKLDGRFYRRLLRTGAGAHIASLPSTNDTDLPAADERPLRQTHPAALAAMTAGIEHDDVVLARLGPRLRDALGERRRLHHLATTTPPARVVLQWAALMADWRETYRDRLAA